MGCYGAAVARGFVCLQVNRRRPQNPTVTRLKLRTQTGLKRDPVQTTHGRTCGLRAN